MISSSELRPAFADSIAAVMSLASSGPSNTVSNPLLSENASLILRSASSDFEMFISASLPSNCAIMVSIDPMITESAVAALPLPTFVIDNHAEAPRSPERE